MVKEDLRSKQSPSKSCSDRITSQHELAKVYETNGQIKKTVKPLEAVVAIEAGVLAEDHSDRLASQHNLAGAYQANGQIKEAVNLLVCISTEKEGLQV